MTSLQIRMAQHEGWRLGVQNAARNAVRQQQTATLMRELEKMLAPPSPPSEPEPQVVVVEEHDPTKLRWPEIHRWWG